MYGYRGDTIPADGRMSSVQGRTGNRLLRTGPNSYELNFPDGSKYLYSLPTATEGPRKVFLTAIVDQELARLGPRADGAPRLRRLKVRAS